MKKLLLIFIVYSSSFIVLNAQNLVPNPSFEIYDSCPNNNDCNISDAIGWSCFGQCVVYFNACAPNPDFNYNGVPYNAAGFQYAHTGNAYAGEYMYFPNSGGIDREYLGTQLLSPLVKGTKYYVNFFVSLGEIDSAAEDDVAVNKLGARFSTVAYNCNNPISPSDTNNYAQIYTDSTITDTLNWTTIRGSFIADSTYKYLIIGNFFTDVTTKKIFYYNTPLHAAAYYIDDVCVSTDSLYTERWTGVNDIKLSAPSLVNVYPNPNNGVFTLSCHSECSEESPVLKVFNVLGEQVLTETLRSAQGDNPINISNQPSGIYILSVTINNQTINKKLIINN